MTSTRLLFIFFTTFFSYTLLGQQHHKVLQATEPQWVELAKLDLAADLPEDQNYGFYCLLIDNQDHLASDQQFRRLSYKVKNSMGIQQMSDLVVNFDPAYQKVEFHSIDVIRDGQTIDKLEIDDIKVVQRESGMESNIYDGQLTVIAHLTDIRIDDVIDFSYTITGSNPVFEGKYSTAFALQFNVPVDFHRYTIIAPKEEDIYYKKLYGAEEPKVEVHKNGIQYTWTDKKIEAVIAENNTPAWFNDSPSIVVSQFSNWQEITDLLSPSYVLNANDRKSLKTHVKKLIPPATDQKKFIENSIRFVQDEVRYLGLENGLNSVIPRKPAEVLERRFGDCKDKSFLLSEILQTQGIDARPLLVHSFNGRNLPSYLPSPYVFDHCVVQIDLGNEGTYYVDPTLSEQGGNLETNYFPDYKTGLLLKPGENELIELPESQIYQTNIDETFELMEIGGGAKLDVVTVYQGNAADLRRQLFLNTNMQALQQEYLNFYSALYPSITNKAPLSYEDDRKENIFKVFESYHIDSLWTSSIDNEKILQAQFYPLALEPNLYPQQSGKRNTPYYLERDSNIKQTTTVYFPSAWNLKNEKRNYGNEYFKYKSDINYKNATLKITNAYTALKDHVAPGDIKSFLQEHKKIQKELTYFVQYNKEALQAAESNSTSWGSILLMLLILAGSSALCYLIYKNYDLPSKIKPKHERKIGGWLIFIGCGLVITPIIVIGQILTSSYFDSSVWIRLFSNSDTFTMGIILIAELIFNSAYLIFSIFVIILFFKKRTIAPRMIIGLYAGVLVFSSIISFSSIYLHPEAFSGPQTQEIYTNLSAMLVRCLIFIPYFLYAERVEETFTKRRKKSNTFDNEEEGNERIMEPEQVLV